MARADNIVDVGEALELSAVGPLCGRPYPVQFRHQGATDAWARALGHTAIRTRWAEPNATCWEIRQEILSQLEHMDPLPIELTGMATKVKTNRRMLAVERGRSSKPRPHSRLC